MTDVLSVRRFGPRTPPRILALHGLTGHGQRWESLAVRLGEYSILAPDLLGHGWSSWAAPWTIDANVAALANLLRREADAPVWVVAHSFGGAVALRLAATSPELVAGLILLDPAVGLDGEWMREIADAMLRSPDFADRDAARADKVSGSWREVDAAELERELDEHLVDLPNGRVGWRIGLPAVMSYWSELARPIAVPRPGTPTTVVRAERTEPPYVTEELVATLREALGSDFTLRDVDCDHMVPLARPAETARLIRELVG
ncbi:alpha/beta hydrolase [Mycobacterium sp. NPDC006124]|uniref:alpha/beta fold hydrolase n=1 Tax=Mycobacterium sp. NPDC006124 TaxID=3156729 RepID=UPI00339E8AD8